ncbi:MAG TPA: hypothetical protein VEG60_22775 [Candidatus Binatia bacterium]|nr:hypothetical protein [Candidatus Binatia bacterium]
MARWRPEWSLPGFAIVLTHMAAGLDACGGHNNRKVGGYHCHRGPLTGQSFGSKDEMLR